MFAPQNYNQTPPIKCVLLQLSRVPSIKIPVFFAQHTPERDRHRI